MRGYLIILVFFIAACNFCCAQDTLKMGVPLLLESGKIDSLMGAIIKSPENMKPAKNDSCLLLCLNRNTGASYIHGIQALANRETIFSTGNFEDQKNIGYFEYGGYLVFAFGDEMMNKFFANTHQIRDFTFIRPTAQQNIFVILNYLSLGITYDQGLFSFKAR